jgi:hypothetical protein
MVNFQVEYIHVMSSLIALSNFTIVSSDVAPQNMSEMLKHVVVCETTH